ncbi:DUF488 domain-containing protein [Peribacillus frigoritolerans]|uniref:DUF488 domain-containing protein n=1 Tax=Peribacillus frigoritolerans TaxID=450367 RepID=UPI002ED359C2|nr:DUF488 domain-containing protein [Peribacillus frigoritolerans]
MKKITGNLFTSNPAGLKYLKEEAEIWQITRGGLTLPGAYQIKKLSPSPSLFQTFTQDWKGKPFEFWWPLYEKRFAVEMQSEEKIRGLRDVYKKLLQGKNVVLVCFCKDHRYCHRRLVGEFFEQYGIRAMELNPITQEQLSLFEGE